MGYSAIGRLLLLSTKSVVMMTVVAGGSLGPVAVAETNQIRQETQKNLGQDTSSGLPLANSIFGGTERLPQISSGRLALPPIAAGTIALKDIGIGNNIGLTPEEFRKPEEAQLADLPESGNERDPGWMSSNYQFAAANTYSHPRYFEDVMLERHGHERFPHLQPFVSGARFFATFPMLPYLMTVNPPCECQSELGYFRAGDCVYPYLQRPPYQRDAAINEGAAIAAGIIAIP